MSVEVEHLNGRAWVGKHGYLTFPYQPPTQYMKTLLLLVLLSCSFFARAQKKYVGPPNNVGREYGNPKMPFVVSHLAGANKERLKRTSKKTHFFLNKIVCFRKMCRIQSGHTASLRSISFKKFKKKIERNAKKGVYKNIQGDSTGKRKLVVPKVKPIIIDSTDTQPFVSSPVVKTDSLIILGAELLFEINKSTLLSEHFATLDPIVDYLILNPDRSVKISGHTDNTGNEAHNVTLSKRRADVVAEYIVNSGIDIKRVKTSGLGSTKPLADNASEEGRKKNRRVELLLHDAE
jgi:outer membrane protein OmpA-like peptidoglycan-associated protein